MKTPRVVETVLPVVNLAKTLYVTLNRKKTKSSRR
jgi:hypothetical protein